MYAPPGRIPRASAAWRSSASSTRGARISFVDISRSSHRIRPEAVAGAPDRLDAVDAEWAVELLSQRADVDLDDVRVVLVERVPRPLEQLIARQDVIRVSHEDLEHLELLRCQGDLAPAARHPAGGGVELEAGDAEHGALLGRAPPPEGAQARQELAEVEWLDEVVVGPGVQPGDAVLYAVASGEHQDRCRHVVR